MHPHAASPADRRPPGARRENSKKKDVRLMNIEAAKAVADAIRTSLGPRGMDKMVGARCAAAAAAAAAAGPAAAAALGCIRAVLVAT